MTFKGKRHSEESKKKIKEAVTGIKSAVWVGDKVGYVALHAWLRRHLPKPDKCEICKERPATEIANVSGKYLRDLKAYQYLCHKCHTKLDNLGRNILEYNKLPTELKNRSEIAKKGWETRRKLSCR